MPHRPELTPPGRAGRALRLPGPLGRGIMAGMTVAHASRWIAAGVLVVLLGGIGFTWRFSDGWAGKPSFDAAEAVLREAGLPATFDEWAATIEPVTPEENAAAPFLRAAGHLADEEGKPIIAAFNDLHEYPPVSAYAAAEKIDLESLESHLAAEADRQAAETAESLQELMAEHPQLKQDLQALAALGGSAAADPNELPDAMKWAIIRAGVAAQAEAIAATEGTEAMRWPVQADYGVPWSDPGLLIEADLGYTVGQRALARLLAGAARQAAAEGRAREAIDLLHRMWSQAEAGAAGSHTYVELMWQAGCEAITLTTAADVLPALPVEALREEEARQALEALSERFADESMLASVRRRGVAGEAIMQMQICREIASATEGMRPKLGIGADINLEPAEDALFMAEVMTGYLAALEAPDEASAKDRLPNMARAEMRMREGELQIAARMLPSLDRFTETTFERLAERRLVRVVVATQLYRADHDGQLPPSLEALVPEYLPAVPGDPTAKNAPIQYDPERAVAWTVGEDRDDDGGMTPEDVLEENPDASSVVVRKSTDRVVRLRE